MRLSTIIKLIAALSFAAAITVWVGVFVSGFFAMNAEMLFSMSLTTAGFAVAALPCSICVERGRHLRTMQTGVGMAAFSALGWGGYFVMQGTLSDDAIETWQNVLVVTTAWAGACTVLSIVVMYRTTNPIVRVLRVLTFIAALTLAAVVVSLAWFGYRLWLDQDLIVKVVSTLVATVGFGMIATILVTRLRQLEGEGEAEEGPGEIVRLDLTVVCPRCGLGQPMQTGGATCRQCGLQVRIIVP